MNPRLLQPEYLDFLPPEEPAAVQSRRDLRLINRIMGNHLWIRRTLNEYRQEGEIALEVGAGTGELVEVIPPLDWVDGLDRSPRPRGWPVRSLWHQTDLLNFEGWDQYPVVVGNLVFHHFDFATLRSLGGKMMQHARVIIACEPVRRPRFRWALEMLCIACRAHPVTRHDGLISILAGFVGDEFAWHLGLNRESWRWTAKETWRGAYHFIAVKKTSRSRLPRERRIDWSNRRDGF